MPAHFSMQLEPTLLRSMLYSVDEDVSDRNRGRRAWPFHSEKNQRSTRQWGIQGELRQPTCMHCHSSITTCLHPGL
jgi:hypothetical protein